MTTPPQQAIWDAIVDIVAEHADGQCEHDSNVCPTMLTASEALAAGIDARTADEQVDTVRWLIRQLHSTNLTNALTESQDHGYSIAVSSAFNIAESGGLIAGMFYIADASGNPRLGDAAELIMRALGTAGSVRTAAAILPALVSALRHRRQQMAAPVRSTR